MITRKARTTLRKNREIARGVRKQEKEWERWGFDSKEEFDAWNNEPVRSEDYFPICHEEDAVFDADYAQGVAVMNSTSTTTKRPGR